MERIEELYQETILEHGQNPRNFGKLKGAACQAEEFNPLCGDRCRVYLKLRGDAIKQISFEGEGCLISKASASLMAEVLRDKKTEEAKDIFEFFQRIVKGELEKLSFQKSAQKLAVFSGISRFPARIKCALLPWYALKSAYEKVH